MPVKLPSKTLSDLQSKSSSNAQLNKKLSTMMSEDVEYDYSGTFSISMVLLILTLLFCHYSCVFLSFLY